MVNTAEELALERRRSEIAIIIQQVRSQWGSKTLVLYKRLAKWIRNGAKTEDIRVESSNNNYILNGEKIRNAVLRIVIKIFCLNMVINSNQLNIFLFRCRKAEPSISSLSEYTDSDLRACILGIYSIECIESGLRVAVFLILD